MALSVDVEKFMELSGKYPVVDVRTPAEFDNGHIPGAFNIPLFSNEERVIIGTIYKQEGRETAIMKGLELVGPKLKNIVSSAVKIDKEKCFLLHCWRGGMRSASVAWLLELYGFKVYVLKGGYKSFRRMALNTFVQPRKIMVIGGRTGSGKTLILKELEKQNEPVVDLEKLAHHKGSSFGSLGEEKQPSQEQFENSLVLVLRKTDITKFLWIEDESRMVGNKVIPAAFWEQMRACKVLYIDIPFDKRADYLTNEYGKFTKENLQKAIERIRKRLGGLNTKLALEAIDGDDLKTACEISLSYYDKAYDFGIEKRDPLTVTKIKFDSIDIEKITEEIKQYGKN